MQMDVIPELTELAKQYADVRDDRMEHTKKEVELKNKVLDMMREHEITSYSDPDSNLTITLETKTKVRVKIGGDEEEEPEE
jgi:hypothetical protein